MLNNCERLREWFHPSRGYNNDHFCMKTKIHKCAALFSSALLFHARPHVEKRKRVRRNVRFHLSGVPKTGAAYASISNSCTKNLKLLTARNSGDRKDIFLFQSYLVILKTCINL